MVVEHLALWVSAGQQHQTQQHQTQLLQYIRQVRYSPMFGQYKQQVKMFFVLQFNSDKTGNNFLATKSQKKLFSFYAANRYLCFGVL